MLFGSAAIVLRVGSWELVVNAFACKVQVKESPFFPRKKGMVSLCHVIPRKNCYLWSSRSNRLSSSKRIIAVIGRGSRYDPGNFPLRAEHAETYVRSALSFIGVTTLETVAAEGVALDREAAMCSAMQAAQQFPI
jgi:hypothetical protein